MKALALNNLTPILSNAVLTYSFRKALASQYAS